MNHKKKAATKVMALHAISESCNRMSRLILQENQAAVISLIEAAISSREMGNLVSRGGSIEYASEREQSVRVLLENGVYAMVTAYSMDGFKCRPYDHTINESELLNWSHDVVVPYDTVDHIDALLLMAHHLSDDPQLRFRTNH